MKTRKRKARKPMSSGNEAIALTVDERKKQIAARLATDPEVISLVKSSMKDIEAGDVVSLEEVFPES